MKMKDVCGAAKRLLLMLFIFMAFGLEAMAGVGVKASTSTEGTGTTTRYYINLELNDKSGRAVSTYTGTGNPSITVVTDQGSFTNVYDGTNAQTKARFVSDILKLSVTRTQYDNFRNSGTLTINGLNAINSDLPSSVTLDSNMQWAYPNTGGDYCASIMMGYNGNARQDGYITIDLTEDGFSYQGLSSDSPYPLTINGYTFNYNTSLVNTNSYTINTGGRIILRTDGGTTGSGRLFSAANIAVEGLNAIAPAFDDYVKFSLGEGQTQVCQSDAALSCAKVSMHAQRTTSTQTGDVMAYTLLVKITKDGQAIDIENTVSSIVFNGQTRRTITYGVPSGQNTVTNAGTITAYANLFGNLSSSNYYASEENPRQAQTFWTDKFGGQKCIAFYVSSTEYNQILWNSNSGYTIEGFSDLDESLSGYTFVIEGVQPCNTCPAQWEVKLDVDASQNCEGDYAFMQFNTVAGVQYYFEKWDGGDWVPQELFPASGTGVTSFVATQTVPNAQFFVNNAQGGDEYRVRATCGGTMKYTYDGRKGDRFIIQSYSPETNVNKVACLNNLAGDVVHVENAEVGVLYYLCKDDAPVDGYDAQGKPNSFKVKCTYDNQNQTVIELDGLTDPGEYTVWAVKDPCPPARVPGVVTVVTLDGQLSLAVECVSGASGDKWNVRLEGVSAGGNLDYYLYKDGESNPVAESSRVGNVWTIDKPTYGAATTTAGKYYVRATSRCGTIRSNYVSIPHSYRISEPTGLCGGSTFEITLSQSDEDVDYLVYTSESATGIKSVYNNATISGTLGGAITITVADAPKGFYYVMARPKGSRITTSTCMVQMEGHVEVGEEPTNLTLNPSSSVCAGTDLSISGMNSNYTYFIYDGSRYKQVSSTPATTATMKINVAGTYEFYATCGSNDNYVGPLATIEVSEIDIDQNVRISTSTTVGCEGDPETSFTLTGAQVGATYTVWKKVGDYADPDSNGAETDDQVVRTAGPAQTTDPIVFSVNDEGEYYVTAEMDGECSNGSSGVKLNGIFTVKKYNANTRISDANLCISDLPRAIMIHNSEANVTYSLYNAATGNQMKDAAGNPYSVKATSDNSANAKITIPNTLGEGAYVVYALRDGCSIPKQIPGQVTLVNSTSTPKKMVLSGSTEEGGILCGGGEAYIFGVSGVSPGVTYELRFREAGTSTTTTVDSFEGDNISTTRYFQAQDAAGVYTVVSLATCETVSGSFTIDDEGAPDVELAETGTHCADDQFGYTIRVKKPNPNATYILYKDNAEVNNSNPLHDINGNDYVPNYPFTVFESGNYTVKGKSRGGCIAQPQGSVDVILAETQDGLQLVAEKKSGTCYYRISIKGINGATTRTGTKYQLYTIENGTRVEKSLPFVGDGTSNQILEENFELPEEGLTLYVSAVPDGLSAGSCEATLNSVVIPGKPTSPTITAENKYHYYCNNDYGVDVKIPLPNNFVGSFYLSRDENGTAIAKNSAGNDLVANIVQSQTGQTITFFGVTADYTVVDPGQPTERRVYQDTEYYLINTDNDGCKSSNPSSVVVKHYDNDPLLTYIRDGQVVCSSLFTDDEEVVIEYQIPAVNEAEGYDFYLTVNGGTQHSRDELIASGELTLETTGKKWIFKFDPDKYGITSGHVNIEVDTKSGARRGVVCHGNTISFDIEAAPTLDATEVQINGISSTLTQTVCDGAPMKYSVTQTGDNVTANTVYYWYDYDWQAGDSKSPVFTTGSTLNHNYSFEYTTLPALVPKTANGDVDESKIAADGFYHLKYWVKADKSGSDVCYSKLVPVEILVRPDRTKVLDATNEKWNLCEDSDPAKLSDYFSQGGDDQNAAGRFFIQGAADNTILLSVVPVNGTFVIDPTVFTPTGIEWSLFGEEKYYRTTDLTYSNPLTPGTDFDKEANFPTKGTSGSGNDGSRVSYYNVYYRSGVCNTFFKTGTFKVWEKMYKDQDFINPEPCYCTNDEITVQGLWFYGGMKWAQVLANGQLWPDQPTDDGKDYTYTFSPLTRHRGNGNGVPVVFTYQAEDIHGCTYTQTKTSMLYQPVANEVFFTIGNLDEAFEQGYSEDYLCPEDNNHYTLTPKIYKYQYWNAAEAATIPQGMEYTITPDPKFTTGKATNVAGTADVPYRAMQADQKMFTTDIDDTNYPTGTHRRAYTNTLGTTAGIDATHSKFTYVVPWATRELDINAPAGTIVSVVSTLNHSTTSGTTETVQIIVDGYYSFPAYNGEPQEYVSAKKVTDAKLVAHNLYALKIAQPLGTDYTYTFSGGNHVVKEANGTYSFIPSEMGEAGSITLNVINGTTDCGGSTCRGSWTRNYRIKRTLQHDMKRSYCSRTGDGTITFAVNYPSRSLTVSQMAAGIQSTIDGINVQKTSRTAEKDAAIQAFNATYHATIATGSEAQTLANTALTAVDVLQNEVDQNADLNGDGNIATQVEVNTKRLEATQMADAANDILSAERDIDAFDQSLTQLSGNSVANYPTTDGLFDYDYGYEGLAGVATVIVRKVESIADDGTRSYDSSYGVGGELNLGSISDAMQTAMPIITYDQNGIGAVTFPDLTNQTGTYTTFSWGYQNGVSGRYEFTYTFVPDNEPAECAMTMTWDVFLSNDTEPFDIYYGHTVEGHTAKAEFPITYGDVQTEWKDLNVNGLWNNAGNTPGATDKVYSDPDVAIDLCRQTSYTDGALSAKNLISFMPESVASPSDIPGTFWIQELNAGGTTRSVPTEEPAGLYDPENAMWKICPENFPASASYYSLYTDDEHLKANTTYRLIYYVGCGNPFSRRVIFTDEHLRALQLTERSTGMA